MYNISMHLLVTDDHCELVDGMTWPVQVFRESSLHLKDQLLAEFSDAIATIHADVYAPLEDVSWAKRILITTHDRFLAYRVQAFFEGHPVFKKVKLGLVAGEDRRSLLRMRWIPLWANSESLEVIDGGPARCGACEAAIPGGLSDRTVERLPRPKHEIFEAKNGLVVIHRDVFDYIRDLIESDVETSAVHIQNKPQWSDRFIALRPLNALGYRLQVVCDESTCPSCDCPRTVVYKATNLWGSLLKEFGEFQGHIALEGKFPEENDLNIRPARVTKRVHSVAVSSALYARLSKRTKGLMEPPHGGYISMNPGENNFIDGEPKPAPKLSVPGGAGGGEDEKLRRRLEEHMRAHGMPVTRVLHDLIPSDPHVDILVAEPTPERPYFTLMTCGMSTRAMPLPDNISVDEATPYIELMLCLPRSWRMDATEDPRWNWPMHWMRQIAVFPHHEQDFVYVGHTFPNGEPPQPFSEQTQLCGWILHIPRTVEPETFCELEIDGCGILPIAMTAIHESEMGFALARNAKSRFELDQALASAGITELLRLDRPPVK